MIKTIRNIVGFCLYLSAEILYVMAECLATEIEPTEADIDRALKAEGWELVEDDFDPLTARKIELEILFNK